MPRQHLRILSPKTRFTPHDDKNPLLSPRFFKPGYERRHRELLALTYHYHAVGAGQRNCPVSRRATICWTE